MTTAVEPARSGLAAVVGESRLVAEPAECAAHAVDGKTPKWVVYPSSAEQVAAVLRRTVELGQAVIPCRNGTKLGMGNPPRAYDVALSLKEMNRVWYYEPADLTITVEPGMKLGDFQRFVGRHGLWLPLDPAGGARASIGGILATNSAGPLRLHYGAPRDMVLGMKIATPEGKVIKTGGRVVKNVAGYDLVKLLIGSYGTLGVIVEATLKLFPSPAARATFVFPTPSLAVARALRRQILRSPVQPLRMILLDAKASTPVRAGTPAAGEVRAPEIWVEAGGTPRVIERCERELGVMGREAGASISRLERETAELGWMRIQDFRGWLAEAYPSLIILKAMLPISASEEFLSVARRHAENAAFNLASFSQTAVGIVHLCLWSAEQPSAMLTLIGHLRRAAEDLGGALVVEKCPIVLKAGLEVWGAPGSGFEVMRKLKQAWDPRATLSPGRFVGGL